MWSCRKDYLGGSKCRKNNEIQVKVVEMTDSVTLQNLVAKHIDSDALVYTDDANVNDKLPRTHEIVKHNISECVCGKSYVTGVR